MAPQVGQPNVMVAENEENKYDVLEKIGTSSHARHSF